MYLLHISVYLSQVFQASRW